MLVSDAVQALERRARRNLGLFTKADAAAVGVSTQLLRYHLQPGGRWLRVLPRVYRLAAIATTEQSRLLAALLWAGPAGLLSHRAAAALHRLDGPRVVPPELWLPNRGRAPGGIVVHRGAVPAADVVTRGPLRYTSLRRTVEDLASVLDEDALEIALESALRQDAALTLTDPATAAARAALHRVLGRRPVGAPATESELETRYLQLIRTADVPAPVRQHRVLDQRGRCLWRLDLCWPEARLWVELDGRGTHEQPAALLSDRHRQNDLAVRLLWVPLRFTWDDVTVRQTDTVALTETAYRRCMGWEGARAQP